MSSLFYKQWRQYFQMPISQRVEQLTLPAFRLYGLLCRMMNESTANTIELSTQQISRLTKIRDRKTIAKARQELKANGLIEARRFGGGVFAHTMLNENGGRISVPKGHKGVRRYLPDALTTVADSTLKERTMLGSAGSGSPSVVNPSSGGNEPIDQVNKFPATECRLHGSAHHWRRPDGTLICDQCHPNPHESNPHHNAPDPALKPIFRQPTAKDLDFR